MRPCASSTRSASRTVTRLTPKRAQRSRSLGRRSPGFSRPSRNSSRIWSTMTWETRPTLTGLKRSAWLASSAGAFGRVAIGGPFLGAAVVGHVSHQCGAFGPTIPVVRGDEVDEIRRTVALGCRILANRGLSDDVLGHISMRIDHDHMLVRCRGPQERGLLFTEPDDIRLVSFDGEVDLPDG